MLLLSTLGLVFGKKLNVVGTLVVTCNNFQALFKVEKTKKKIRNNTNFYGKLVFDEINFGFFLV